MPRDAIEFEVPFFRRGGGQAKTRFADTPIPDRVKRPLRAAQMLALAYQMDRLIEIGVVRDRTEMARVTGFDDSRISQIMNLLWLAPDIQEALLVTEIAEGRDGVTAKELMPIARCASWPEQRRLWRNLSLEPLPPAGAIRSAHGQQPLRWRSGTEV